MNIQKIVLISSTSLSEPVTRNRLLPFINMLLDKNIEVTLVCPKTDNLNFDTPLGLHIQVVNLNKKKPTGFIQRAFKEMLDCSSILIMAKKQDADGYLVTIPSMFLAFFSPLFLSNNHVFIDIRDLPWEYLSDKRLLHRLSKTIFKKCFNISVNFYKLVAVTNPTELTYIEKIWNKKSKPFLVSNGIMREQFKKLSNVSLSNNNKTVITYLGNVGIAQNLETLILVAQKVPDVCFRIVGSGVELSKLRDLITSLKIKNVELIGRVPWNEVKRYYDDTTVLYAQLAPEFSGAMPSKLYEYLSTGKYVIYAGMGQASEILSQFEHNTVIQPCNIDALTEIVTEVNMNKKKYNCLNLNNRDLIDRNYVRENTASDFIDAIVSYLKT